MKATDRTAVQEDGESVSSGDSAGDTGALARHGPGPAWPWPGVVLARHGGAVQSSPGARAFRVQGPGRSNNKGPGGRTWLGLFKEENRPYS